MSRCPPARPRQRAGCIHERVPGSPAGGLPLFVITGSLGIVVVHKPILVEQQLIAHELLGVLRPLALTLHPCAHTSGTDIDVFGLGAIAACESLRCSLLVGEDYLSHILLHVLHGRDDVLVTKGERVDAVLEDEALVIKRTQGPLLGL